MVKKILNPDLNGDQILFDLPDTTGTPYAIEYPLDDSGLFTYIFMIKTDDEIYFNVREKCTKKNGQLIDGFIFEHNRYESISLIANSPGQQLIIIKYLSDEMSISD
jgi:hypothetical protein